MNTLWCSAVLLSSMIRFYSVCVKRIYPVSDLRAVGAQTIEMAQFSSSTLPDTDPRASQTESPPSPLIVRGRQHPQFRAGLGDPLGSSLVFFGSEASRSCRAQPARFSWIFASPEEVLSFCFAALQSTLHVPQCASLYGPLCSFKRPRRSVDRGGLQSLFGPNWLQLH